MKSKPTVIVTHQLPAEWLSTLHGRCQLIVGPPTTETSGLSDPLWQSLPQADGLLTMLTVKVDDALLAQAPRLKVVSNMAVGVDNIDLDACTRRGIPVGHTPGVLTDGTADLGMALLLAAARKIPQAAADAKAGKWTTWLPDGWLGADLQGAVLGIVGLGQIGTAVAERAAAFGMKLVYTSRTPKPEAEARLGITRLPLSQLLAQSDFVMLTTALTPETRHLINNETLAQMKPSAMLINLARGPVVDTPALVAALQNGTIAAAALDVTDPEPLPASHPLYQLDNCLIAPHIGSATANIRRRMAELACQNVLAGLAGTPLPHCANLPR
ncbi:MAG: D-glycerate dehydrogenase [Bacteroidetes bacterium]|nr:MAG: D-glycerate dehydrogenase [Bacteroidota bacterium]